MPATFSQSLRALSLDRPRRSLAAATVVAGMLGAWSAWFFGAEVTVARALLQRAELIILDESFAALDPATLERALRCVLARARAVLVIAHP